ncbi:hypothetical protein EVAR_47647_1 [Eumeta japonica]|uniref:Uncharacterized protein n=1 Tax=Eumeta variegata TaxID=151549 RepID=A0A4C1XZT7_EUMVA|nr:hypothetical protein EVAR_47647_1 [Eumeta japonica]
MAAARVQHADERMSATALTRDALLVAGKSSAKRWPRLAAEIGQMGRPRPYHGCECKNFNHHNRNTQQAMMLRP